MELRRDSNITKGHFCSVHRDGGDIDDGSSSSAGSRVRRLQVWAADHLSLHKALDVGKDGATRTSLSNGNRNGRIVVAEKTTFLRPMQFLPFPPKRVGEEPKRELEL